MKKRFLALALSAALIAGALPAYGAPEAEPLKDYGTPGVDYVEGEAIICLDTSAAPAGEAMLQGGGGYQLESLMELDTPADAEPASELFLQSGSEAVGNSPADAGSSRELILVSAKDGQSTPELIRELEEDPAVLFAEPNYISHLSDFEEEGEFTQEALPSSENGDFALEKAQPSQDGGSSFTNEAAADGKEGSQPADGAALDLTPLQWHISNNTGHPQFDLNVEPLYQEGITGQGVVIAVLDSGVDYTHPDLAPQMWDDGLSYPSLTQMGGGKYGINLCPGYPDTTDPMDDLHHGTHCAGIIGAAWNGEGVSGVAGGVEIMALKQTGKDGSSVNSSTIQGYAYMKAAVEAGVNLRAVNNSWVGLAIGSSLQLAVNELGRMGVLSIFGAGNSTLDHDVDFFTSLCSAQTPYALTVNSLDHQGVQSSFSDYGQTSTDLWGMGNDILSIYPVALADFNALFVKENLVYSGFEGSSTPATDRPDVPDAAGQTLAFYEYQPDTDTTGELLSSAEDAFFGNRNLQLPVQAGERVSAISSPITLPAGEEDLYLSFAGHALNVTLMDVHLQNEDGIIDLEMMNNNDLIIDGAISIRSALWSNYYAKLPAAALEKPFRLVLTSEEVEESTTLFLDCFGIGRGMASYTYSSGTSMATPTVTALVGLLASAYPDEDAADISARISGGVNRTDAPQLDKNCISGGFPDAWKAYDHPDPAIQEVLDDGTSVTLRGRFFGNTQGTVSMGSASADITAWNDREIQFLRPEGYQFSGMTEFRVTRADGAWGRNYRLYDEQDDSFESLPLPTPETEGYSGSAWEQFGTFLFDSAAQVAALDQKLYFTTGSYYYDSNFGYGNENPITELWCYDISGKTWTRMADLPSLTYMPASLCAWKGNLYLLGLVIDDDDLFNMLYRFDPETNTWDKGTALDNLFGYGAVLLNYKEKLVMTGGSDLLTNEYSDAFWELNPADGSVKEMDLHMPQKGMILPNIAVCGEKRDQLVLAEHATSDTIMSPSREAWFYDGKEWTSVEMPKSEPFLRGFSALGGTADGALLSGLWERQENGTRDTLLISEGKAQFIENRFSSMLTCFHRGIAYDGYFYAMGYNEDAPENLIFKRMPVRTADASEEPLPTVTPTPGALKKAPPAKDPIGDGPRKYGQDNISRPKR